MPRLIPSCKQLFRPAAIVMAVLALQVTAASAGAQAATSEAEAARLKTIFETMLQDSADRAAQNGRTLQQDGDVIVEPFDGYYAATLPHLTSVDADGSKFEIGILAINAIPTAKADEWKMTMAIPTPLIAYDETGKTEATITIGRQNFAGVWNETYKLFTQFQAQYNDVRVTAADKSYDATIPHLSVISDLQRQASGHWSGPTRVRLNDFALKNDAGTETKLAQAEATFTIKDYDLGMDMTAYATEMQELTSSLSTVGEDGANAISVFKILPLSLQMASKITDGFGAHYSFQGLTVTNPANDNKPQTSFTLPQANVQLDANGLRGTHANIALKADYKDARSVPALPSAQYNPATAVIDLSLDKVPHKDIAQSLRTAKPDANPLALLTDILGKNGSTLTIRNVQLINPIYDAHLTGQIIGAPKTAKGFTGNGKLTFAGLDDLVNALRTTLADPKTPDAARVPLQNAVPVLTMMQLMGQQGQSASGKPARLYNVEVNNNGQMLLNGTSLDALFSGAIPTP